MRIAVTGARGFIGSYLVSELYEGGHEVVSWDRDDGDLATQGRAHNLLEDARPDVVVHLAAKYGRLLGEVDPAFTVQQNAQATVNVARACGDYAVRLVYASSSEAYGDHEDRLIVEDALYDCLPHNIYGLTKRWGEEACLLYAPEGLLIARMSMPYGPNQPVGFGRCALTTMLWTALNKQKITVHRGSERSWIYVEDMARALRHLIETQDGVFNVGRDDDSRLMLEIAKRACLLADAPYSLIRQVAAPPMQTLVKRTSNEKLRNSGFVPSVSIDEGMEKTMAWLSARVGITVTV
jgi:nucleoside-diphosphate-sugar epimerase